MASNNGSIDWGMAETPAIDRLRDAARALAGGVVDLDVLRAIQAAQDALDAAKVEVISRVEETRGARDRGRLQRAELGSTRAAAVGTRRPQARHSRTLLARSPTSRNQPSPAGCG